MIPYQSIDVKFNGVPEQCFVLEVIVNVQYLIEKKYIDLDPVLAIDVNLFNTATGPYPKTGGVLAANTFIGINGTSFYSTYHSIIRLVGSKPEMLGAPFDITQLYNQ